MSFINNFSLESLFLVILFSAISNAFFGMWRAYLVNKDEGMTISQFLALPEAKIFKRCIEFTLIILMVYCVVNIFIFLH